jgi:signal transduction histidine kinase/ActR/RegA family two-component response regulator
VAGTDDTVDAISVQEHARLRRDLTDATQQFAATNEVLTALGRHVSDPDAVLDTIVENARRLCRAGAALISTLEGDVYRISRAVGLSDEYIAHLTEHPVAHDRSTLQGRAGLDRRTEQITDVLADPNYGRQDIQRIAGYRTLMASPMLIDNEVVGALLVWRTAVDPFDEREAALLGAFASQAAIAVNNVNLVQNLETRSAELARKVDQLEALGEVGEAISSSLDLDEVLSSIVMNAVKLSETDGGSIMEYDDAERLFTVRSAYGTAPEVLERLRRTRIELDSTLCGRAGREGRPLAVADLDAVPLDAHLQCLYDDGWRSAAVVPMLRENQIVGVLVVRRKSTGSFSDETLEFLQSFAAQSALALHNARLFRELETKGSELEIASRHKSEFLASMSHELRTPLNAVIGFSEVLLERMFGDINERQEEYLRDIWSSGKHLLELLNEILDLSKVEAGQMQLDVTTFPVREALEYALAMLRERALLHQVELDLDVAVDVGVVEADELRFKQVVLNLLTNAVKFTPDGGRIVVRARSQEGELLVAVTDTGIGIPEEDRERIFESFQQGGRGASNEEGTGLGLTVCRRMLELHGGRIWIESEVGKGSTFTFALPLGSMEVDVPGAVEPRPDGGVRRVVLIEDDRPSLDLMSAYLQDARWQVCVARDGAEGLTTVRTVEPAVVILDIRLPRVDGWDVLRALKADPTTAKIPVIVVSIVDERTKGLSLGAAEYLVKPVGRSELLAALAEVGLFDGTGTRDHHPPRRRAL